MSRISTNTDQYQSSISEIDIADLIERSKTSLRILEDADLSMVLRVKLIQTWRFTLSKLLHLHGKAQKGELNEEFLSLQQQLLPKVMRHQIDTAGVILRASENQSEAHKNWQHLWKDFTS